jgi:hypothetical protein
LQSLGLTSGGRVESKATKMDSYDGAKLDLLYWSGTIFIAIAGFFLLNYLWSVTIALF